MSETSQCFSQPPKAVCVCSIHSWGSTYIHLNVNHRVDSLMLRYLDIGVWDKAGIGQASSVLRNQHFRILMMEIFKNLQADVGGDKSILQRDEKVFN